MADYYDQAGQGIDQGKAALLQAIATQGSQAHAALQAGQDQIAAAKQVAIQQALQGAQARGAQQPELDQLSRTVSQPYDAQLAGLASSQASRDAGFATQSGAAGTYMDEAKAGLPALRTQLAQKVASLQASAQQQAMTNQQAVALRNIELQIAQANLAKSQQDSSGGNLSSIISKLGGTDLAGGLLSGALVGNGQITSGVPGAQGGSLTDQANRAAFVGSPEDQFDPTQRLSDATGIPSAAIGQLVGGYQQKQDAAATKQAAADQKQFNAANPDLAAIGRNVGLSMQGVQQMIATPEYKKAQQLAEAGLQSGKTIDDLKAALGAAPELRNKPKTRAAIIYQYEREYPSSSYVPGG